MTERLLSLTQHPLFGKTHPNLHTFHLVDTPASRTEPTWLAWCGANRMMITGNADPPSHAYMCQLCWHMLIDELTQEDPPDASHPSPRPSQSP